jgi:hypothetical protein
MKAVLLESCHKISIYAAFPGGIILQFSGENSVILGYPSPMVCTILQKRGRRIVIKEKPKPYNYWMRPPKWLRSARSKCRAF